jgi:dTDP-4-dehydrorhamnose 3,5-epimerase
MTLEVTPCAHPEVLLLRPRVHRDARGEFLESYNEREFRRATGLAPRFVQDNLSRSAQGVLRGLHYQLDPPQGKLVGPLAGRIFDVAVDLRPKSPRLGQWVGVELDASRAEQLWIPPGFAHGFLVLSERADVLYKCTTHYAPHSERTIVWNDATLAITWPLEGGAPVQLSPKDAAAPGWSAALAELSAHY